MVNSNGSVEADRQHSIKLIDVRRFDDLESINQTSV